MIKVLSKLSLSDTETFNDFIIINQSVFVLHIIIHIAICTIIKNKTMGYIVTSPILIIAYQ